MSLARRPRAPSRATSDTERDAMRVRRDTVGRVNHLHEGIPFDKDLIAGLDIGINRFQVEDEISCSIGARRENSGVIAALRVNSRTLETQLDVLRKWTAPGD